MSANGVLVAGGCYPADYFEAISRVMRARGDAPGDCRFSDADLPAIRSELAIVAWERRKETRLLRELLDDGQLAPAAQSLVAELLARDKPLPTPRHSKWRDRAIAVEVDRVVTGGHRVGAAYRQVAAMFLVSTSTVEAAVRNHRAWLAARKAELSPGEQLSVWL